MPRREGSEPLVNCLDLPCPWATEYRQCRYRVAQRGDHGFPRALCAFYSTPGPHTPNRIAQVTGLSIEAVNKTIDAVHAKLRARIATSQELRFDPKIQALVDDHLEGIPA